jgi:hypothetical protein
LQRIKTVALLSKNIHAIALPGNGASPPSRMAVKESAGMGRPR